MFGGYCAYSTIAKSLVGKEDEFEKAELLSDPYFRNASQHKQQ
jgi:hypothetical protein